MPVDTPATTMWSSAYEYVVAALGSQNQTRCRDNTNAKKTSLLGIPPELRNKIYRLAIVQSDISSTAEADSILFDLSTHCEPNLLQTCRQIRGEASAIFLEENGFAIVVQDLLPQMPPRSAGHWIWRAKLVRYTYYGGPNWANLKEWMRLQCADELRGAAPAKALSAVGLATYTLSRVTAHASEIARAMQAKGASWEEIEVVLEAYKMGVDGSHGLKRFWA